MMGCHLLVFIPLRIYIHLFVKKYKKDYPSLELIKKFCGNFESLMLHLGIDMDDEELMDHEIKEALFEFNYQSSCSSEELVSEPWIQEEHVQEVVFLGTSEEQGYTDDQPVEEQDVTPFSLTNNRTELSHPPRYDEYDDDSFEQPILDTSLGSNPIYNDSASYLESNEDIDDILSTSEWEVSHQNVACLENTHLIINKKHKQVVGTSFQNDTKVTVLAQEQLEVKEEAPLSPSAHPKAHNHLSQAPSPFLGKEIGQIITNFCEGDVEIEEVEQRESYLKEEVAIIPQIQVERKLFDERCPSSFDVQQGVLTLVFQDPFSILLETSEEKVLKACLKLTNVFDLSGRASFQDGTYFSIASLLSRPYFLSKNKDLLIIHLVN